MQEEGKREAMEMMDFSEPPGKSSATTPLLGEDDKFDQSHFASQQNLLNEARRLKLQQLFPPPSHPVLIEWRDLNYQIPVKKSWRPFSRKKPSDEVETRSILKNLNGCVCPGEFLAILGPSGAGKTSLLHALAGRIPLTKVDARQQARAKKVKNATLTGSILVNGVARDATPVDVHSCFVLQDDIFFGELTVRQTLRFAARLSMPKEVSLKEKDNRAEELMELLGIKKCADTCVGSVIRRGISGGEKKRLNIANELTGNATVVMMDEPTSGLDASSALAVVKMLSDLAKSGRTVIATLHQPSSLMFHMFDKLLLLADGQTAYLGKASDAVAYFESLGFECPKQFNPADYMLSLLDEVPANSVDQSAMTYRKAILEAYRKRREDGFGSNKDNSKRSSLDVDEEEDMAWQDPNPSSFTPSHLPPPLTADGRKGFQASIWTQMWLLAMRGAKQHMIEAIPNMFIFLVMGILASMVWWRLGYKEDDLYDRTGLHFFVVSNAFIMPMFSALGEVANERIVIRKERPSHIYRLSAYIVSKIMANTPIDAISPIIMCALIYWTCNLNDKFTRFLIYCILSFFGQLSGMGLGIILGVNFDRPEEATPWVIAVFFLFTIMGGFYVTISNMPSWFRWTQYISLTKYWMDAVLVNEFDDPDHVFKVAHPAPGEPKFITGEDYLDTRELIFGFRVWPAMIIMFGFFIAAQVGAYFLLRWHTQKKRA